MRKYLITMIILSLCTADPYCRFNNHFSFTARLNKALLEDKISNYTETYIHHLYKQDTLAIITGSKLYHEAYKVQKSIISSKDETQYISLFLNNYLNSYNLPEKFYFINSNPIPTDVESLNLSQMLLVFGFLYVYYIVSSE